MDEINKNPSKELADLLSRLPDPKDMTKSEIRNELTQLRMRLKALRAVPRSDWHGSLKTFYRRRSRIGALAHT